MARKSKLTINLPGDLIEQGKAQSENIGSSLSVVIERLLASWLASGGQIPPQPTQSKPKGKRS